MAILFVFLGIFLGYFIYSSQIDKTSSFPFRFGLDLSGGTSLLYQADTKALPTGQIKESMNALRDVIERRVNLFGVSESVVQLESRGSENRLIVELPGVTDINKAVELIGQTPVLEFKQERSDGKTKEILEAQDRGEQKEEEPFSATSLTGRYIKKATVEFSQTSLNPSVSLEFSAEGSKLFAEITKANVNKILAIYLDGSPISKPVVREEIKDGKASISGNFTVEEARTLVGRLNSGALPVPIKLISTQIIGASLGEKSLERNVLAGIYGTAAVALFLILWYRARGLVAVIALALYILMTLTIFKLIPVTLTAAGIAGFIMSIGMAVDANILIFERTKEELKKGRDLETALDEGFRRSWFSIRDSNISSLITASVLFWLGTSLVKGFALTFGLGVLLSMFTAINVTRSFLYAIYSDYSK